MVDVPTQPRRAPWSLRASTETPVLDIAELAKQIAAIKRIQATLLEVQNHHDARLEDLSSNLRAITTRTYSTKGTGIDYDDLFVLLEPTYAHTLDSWTYQLSQKILLDPPSPEIRKAADEKVTAQAVDGVPIEKLLTWGGSLLFLVSISSIVVWLTGDIALIHPAASVIGLLVSPCLYLMGLTARKQSAS